jgi:hypothetical protein
VYNIPETHGNCFENQRVVRICYLSVTGKWCDPELGKSLYYTHTDGDGVVVVSGTTDMYPGYISVYIYVPDLKVYYISVPVFYVHVHVPARACMSYEITR